MHIDMAVGLLLLGFIAFQMGFFYMLHHQDQDLRKSSWEVVSTTISIFVAVLVFEAVSELLHHASVCFLRGRGWNGGEVEEYFTCMVAMAHLAIVFVIMHIVIARLAYSELKSFTQPERKVSILCWATLFSHATAWAAIECGSSLHFMSFIKDSPGGLLIPIVIVAAVLFLLFRCSDLVRHASLDNADEVMQEADRNAEAIRAWAHAGEEAEDEVATLAVSFLLVQSTRYCVSGVPASAEASANLAVKHPTRCALEMLAVCMVFVLLTVLAVSKVAREKIQAMGVKRRSSVSLEDILHRDASIGRAIGNYLRRWSMLFHKITGVAAAWCLLCALRWELLRMPKPAPGGHTFRPESTTMCVLLALLVSVLGFALIIFMDKMADADWTGEVTDIAIRTLINSIGVLIGFAWEQAFESSFKGIWLLAGAEGHWKALVAQLGLSLVIGVIVTPAWRLYILTEVIRLRETQREGSTRPETPEAEDEMAAAASLHRSHSDSEDDGSWLSPWRKPQEVDGEETPMNPPRSIREVVLIVPRER